MHFSKEFIEKVKAENPLLGVIKGYLEMKKDGKLWVGKCPFHGGDTKPSFTYYENDQHAYCYGCNTLITDSIDFIRNMEHLTFPEAVEFLVERAGLDYPDDKQMCELKEKRKLQQELENKLEEFRMNLNKKKYQHVKKYLMEERKLTEKDINKWKLGYCDFKYADEDDSKYRKFTNRIIFPIFNHRNKIVGFSGRVLPENESDYAKYINSSCRSNYLFKEKNFYGLNLAKKSIIEKNEVFWVEGFFDVILMHKQGVTNTIGSMGTSITGKQIKLIKGFCDKVILFLDPDEAGRKALKDNIVSFSKEDMELRMIENKKGMDPADTVKKLETSFSSWIKDNTKSIEIFFGNKFLDEYNIKVSRAKQKLIKNLCTVFKGRLGIPATEIALEAIARRMSMKLDTLKNEIRDNNS